MRRLILVLAFLAPAACKGPAARLVAGNADTIVVNNQKPVQLPMRVFDAAGHSLDSAGVQYQWTAGVPVSVSATGVVTCTQAGDATVRASLGRLTTQLILLCRPVGRVRSLRMMNLVVGGPAQELPFDAVDADGRPVTLLTGQVTVEDSTIATVEGVRVRARTTGSTGLTMRIGDRLAYASVHVYERARTPEGIRAGQRLAVPVRLGGGEMRRWRISASPDNYFLAILPDNDAHPAPALAIVGANCSPGLGPQSYFCLAQHDASVIVYHPQQVDFSQRVSGTLAVWHQGGH
jgi:hypothetical protein